MRILFVEYDSLIRELVVEARRHPRLDRRRGTGIVRAKRRRCSHHRRATAGKRRWMADRRTLKEDPGLRVIYAIGFSPVAPRPAGTCSCASLSHREVALRNMSANLRDFGNRDCEHAQKGSHGWHSAAHVRLLIFQTGDRGCARGRKHGPATLTTVWSFPSRPGWHQSPLASSDRLPRLPCRSLRPRAYRQLRAAPETRRIRACSDHPSLRR